ncbi:MFS transporter, partial [Dermatophilus congolensis]
MTFIMGAGEAIFEPAYDSFIPELVADPALASANASSNVLRGTGQFAGPALGAVVVTEFGVNAALTIDAATFVVSTLAVLIAGRHRLEVLAESRGDKPVSMVREALDGLRVVIDLKWPGVLELMALVHVLLAVGPWMVLLPFVAAEGGGNLYGYGATLSAFAVGGVWLVPPSPVRSWIDFEGPGPGLSWQSGFSRSHASPWLVGCLGISSWA